MYPSLSLSLPLSFILQKYFRDYDSFRFSIANYQRATSHLLRMYEEYASNGQGPIEQRERFSQASFNVDFIIPPRKKLFQVSFIDLLMITEVSTFIIQCSTSNFARIVSMKSG